MRKPRKNPSWANPQSCLEIRVIVAQTTPVLQFTVQLPAGHVKPFSLDEYQQKAYRGLQGRHLIEAVVVELLTELGQPTENIKLIFL